MLQEDKGTTYIRQRNDGSDRKDSFVSSITNNSPQNVNAEYTGSTESTVSHTSNINGSSSYTMGHSVTVGTMLILEHSQVVRLIIHLIIRIQWKKDGQRKNP